MNRRPVFKVALVEMQALLNEALSSLKQLIDLVLLLVAHESHFLDGEGLFE